MTVTWNISSYRVGGVTVSRRHVTATSNRCATDVSSHQPTNFWIGRTEREQNAFFPSLSLSLSLSVNGTEALLCCCIVLAIDYLHCKYCTVVFAMTRQWTKRPKALTPSALATHKWRLTTMPMGREGPKCTVQLVPKNHLISDIVIYFYRLHNEGGGCGPITVCR